MWMGRSHSIGMGGRKGDTIGRGKVGNGGTLVVGGEQRTTADRRSSFPFLFPIE